MEEGEGDTLQHMRSERRCWMLEGKEGFFSSSSPHSCSVFLSGPAFSNVFWIRSPLAAHSCRK